MCRVWTPELVEEEMVAAFRRALISIATIPVFSSRAHLLRPVIKTPRTAAAAEALDILNWPEMYVPEARRRQFLMFRVSDKARRRNGIAEACREFGIERRTFDRWCARSLGEIAAGLTNAAACPLTVSEMPSDPCSTRTRGRV